MHLIISLLQGIARLSVSFPRSIISLFVLLAVAGFYAMPHMKISTNLISGIGNPDSIINITKENNEIFGEQDSLIVVLEFPEPPGESRLEFLTRLADDLSNQEGVRRVRYRFVDPDDKENTQVLLSQFLLGMNERERNEIKRIFSVENIPGAVRRNVNRLFLTENPYLQEKLLQDPLELGQFVAESMKKRVGSVSLGDVYLLIASPDSTVFLIQVTPNFPSSELVEGKKLLTAIRKNMPQWIHNAAADIPRLKDKSKDIKWYLTGKTVFHNESDVIFDQESSVILLFSFGMVSVLLIIVYRSLSAGLIFMIPIICGVGPNYGLTYLLYDEVNPVVISAAGVLFGLGTDYGVHLWGRMREEIDKGSEVHDAISAVYSLTGPPVILGAITSILAFLCLCLSNQPAMIQFGYVGASGLFLTLLSTIFLFPALAILISRRRNDYYPRISVSFSSLSGLFLKHPKTIAISSIFIIGLAAFFASDLHYEKDVFKVFLARDMQSMSVSDRISRKFQSNFSHPAHLSFEAPTLEEGLQLQRKLDELLMGLTDRSGPIASFDSISYLMSPKIMHPANTAIIGQLTNHRESLEAALDERYKSVGFSESAIASSRQALSDTLDVMELVKNGRMHDTSALDIERSWYLAKLNGNFRFLTQIRYDDTITSIEDLKKADDQVLETVKNMPLTVHMSGPRQIMEEILSSLISELIRLGTYVILAVVIFFFALFRHPLGVLLSLIPMVGAFAVSMGILGLLGMGLPFSIVGVVPLIFGLGMDNGVHVVMGSLHMGGSIIETMKHVTRPIIFTSLTNIMGFISMLTSRHYSIEFLGWCMVLGMIAAVTLTLTTLPAIILLLERKALKSAGHQVQTVQAAL